MDRWEFQDLEKINFKVSHVFSIDVFLVKAGTTYDNLFWNQVIIQNLKGSCEILENLNLNSKIKTRNQEAFSLFMFSPGRPLRACKEFGMRFPYKTHCLIVVG